jgi:hypothetical protein
MAALRVASRSSWSSPGEAPPVCGRSGKRREIATWRFKAMFDSWGKGRRGIKRPSAIFVRINRRTKGTSCNLITGIIN